MKIDAGRTFRKRECPSCACEVETNQNRCPICGYLFPQATAAQRGMRWGGAVIMLALFFYLLFRWF